MLSSRLATRLVPVDTTLEIHYRSNPALLLGSIVVDKVSSAQNVSLSSDFMQKYCPAGKTISHGKNWRDVELTRVSDYVHIRGNI